MVSTMRERLRPLLQFIVLTVTGAACVTVLTLAVTSFLAEEDTTSYAVPEDPYSDEFARFPVSVDPVAKEIS